MGCPQRKPVLGFCQPRVLCVHCITQNTSTLVIQSILETLRARLCTAATDTMLAGLSAWGETRSPNGLIRWAGSQFFIGVRGMYVLKNEQKRSRWSTQHIKHKKMGMSSSWKENCKWPRGGEHRQPRMMRDRRVDMIKGWTCVWGFLTGKVKRHHKGFCPM